MSAEQSVMLYRHSGQDQEAQQNGILHWCPQTFVYNYGTTVTMSKTHPTHGQTCGEAEEGAGVTRSPGIRR